MASGDPFTVDLAGTKDNDNRNFVCPIAPDPNQHFVVYHAGKTLYPVHELDPDGPVEGYLRFKLTGADAIEVGIAPGPLEDLWAQGIEL